VKYLGTAPLANVSIMHVAMRWLEHTGPVPSAELEAAIRPATVTPGKADALDATMKVAVHVGLVVAEPNGGGFRNADRPELAEALADHRSFRSLVRGAVLQRAVVDVDGGNPPDDVPLALTWLCSLDPARPAPWTFSTAFEQELADDGMYRDVILNPTQWNSFRRWAVALGLAVSVTASTKRSVLVPDPTVAIEDVLRGLQGEGAEPKEMSAREFLDQVTRALPVLDSGALESAARAQGVRYLARGDALVGPATGHALERLARRGHIELKHRADAEGRVSYQVGGRLRSVDSIVIGASNG
jgi:hypothetical protein